MPFTIRMGFFRMDFWDLYNGGIVGMYCIKLVWRIPYGSEELAVSSKTFL